VSRPAIVATLVAIGLPFGALAPSARADGDPASDYLLVQNVFLPLSTEPSAEQQAQLTDIVRRANLAGFKIRVAVIASAYDLGSATVLYGHPREYARFLGSELSFLYKSRLLVVMPSGFGFNWPKHSGTAEDQQLARIPIGPGPGGLLAAAATAVERLAAAKHIEIGPSTRTTLTTSHTTRDRLLIIATTLAAICVATATRFALRRRGR